MNAANEALARGDHAAAVAEFKKLAEQGNKKAQAHLGYMYYIGEGVEQDYVKAVKWYKKAAILGDKDSQYNLAVAYAFGEGIKQDYKEAFQWYRRAAEQNHVVAQYSIGVSYAYGEGIEQNPELAAEWFQKAANQGYERAQILLGSLYHTGDGVEKNYEKAALWYRKAADKGNAAAQYNLGTLYRAGNGVGQDYNQAVRWFRLSADQGYAAAQNELESIERAVAGANRPAPIPVPEVETVPVQTEVTPAESAEESSELIPTLAKTEATTAEPVVTAAEEKVEAPTIEPVEEEITESSVEEEPKRGFFSRLFGKKDTANAEPEQSGVVYATPEETTAAESGYDPVEKTEIETPEEVINPEPESSPPEVAVIEEIAEPETIDSSAPDVEEDVTAIEEKPKRGFFSRLFGKKDDPLKQHEEDLEVPEVTEQPLDESPKVIAYAADSAPEGQQLESLPGSKITEDVQQDSVTTATEPPENISSDDMDLEEATSAEADLTDENASEAKIEEISEEDAPKKGFFSRLFSKNETEENTISTEVVDIDASEEPVIIAKLEDPDQDELDLDVIKQRESEEAFIDSIEVTPDLEHIDSASQLKPLAVKGDSKAQFQLGTLYHQGISVRKDLTQAFLWYRRSAQQGDSDAQYSLGNMYLMGEGIKQDDYQARQWYEKAAEQGHEGAQHNLESLQRIATAEPAPEPEYDPDNNILPEQDDDTLEEEPEEKSGFFSKLFGKDDADEEELDQTEITAVEIEEFDTSSDKISTESSEATDNSPSSTYEKGLAFEFGEGVPQSYSTAFEFFKKSADQNYAPAQYKVGLAYAYGQGADKDPVAAVEWYKKAATQGYALAQRTLATLYMGGDGIEQNKPLALAWYDILADSGNVMDIHRRNALKEKLTPDEIDEATRLKQELSN